MATSGKFQIRYGDATYVHGYNEYISTLTNQHSTCLSPRPVLACGGGVHGKRETRGNSKHSDYLYHHHNPIIYPRIFPSCTHRCQHELISFKPCRTPHRTLQVRLGLRNSGLRTFYVHQLVSLIREHVGSTFHGDGTGLQPVRYQGILIALIDDHRKCCVVHFHSPLICAPGTYEDMAAGLIRITQTHHWGNVVLSLITLTVTWPSNMQLKRVSTRPSKLVLCRL